MSEYKVTATAATATTVLCNDENTIGMSYGVPCVAIPESEYKEWQQYKVLGTPEEFAELKKAKEELLETLFQTTKVLDQLHPMDESEPCYIFDIWKKAMNILVRESALQQIGGGE